MAEKFYIDQRAKMRSSCRIRLSHITDAPLESLTEPSEDYQDDAPTSNKKIISPGGPSSSFSSTTLSPAISSTPSEPSSQELIVDVNRKLAAFGQSPVNNKKLL